MQDNRQALAAAGGGIHICGPMNRAASAPRVAPGGLDDLVDLLSGRRIAVLTGAGCSTESGIPDYRGPETRKRARNPIRYNAFRRDSDARRRYWARSVVGWGRMRDAAPNAAHRALASMERTGLLTGLITQNVDRLHRKAGSDAIELHGALADVRCLDCERFEDRDALQARLLGLNPGWDQAQVEIAPDGDAELDGERLAQFRVAPCLACGGPLKPHVVFFGESVPRPRVEAAYAQVEEADALLVIGSSLAVFSGYRFVRRAAKNGTPVGIVNLGETRGDGEATVRVEARCGDILPRLAHALGA